MRDGKFPMLDAIHDVSHFVAFRRFPEFAHWVQWQMSKLTLDQVKAAKPALDYDGRYGNSAPFIEAVYRELSQKNK